MRGVGRALTEEQREEVLIVYANRAFTWYDWATLFGLNMLLVDAVAFGLHHRLQ